MNEIRTTKRQREILRHALFGSSGAKKPYRNMYCFEFGSDVEKDIAALTELGLMYLGKTINDGRDCYAHVTPEGAAEIDATLPKDE